jgi:predicted transcriptional regulator
MFNMRAASLSIALVNLTFTFSSYGYSQDSTAADNINATAILSGQTELAREQWLRRQLFVENILTRVSTDLTDSTLFFRLQRNSEIGLNKSQLSRIPPRQDRIAEQLRREELEAPPMLSVGNLLGAGVKYLAEKFGRSPASSKPFAIIPSELEIEVLNVLWKENHATTSEIYAQLDSAQITAADLQQSLAVMTDRGLLDRQQISPRNEFTLLGGIAIEMSAKNRKNREYLYRPKISRQTMLSFLDATAFSHRLTSANDHSLIVEHLRKLMKKLVVAEE